MDQLEFRYLRRVNDICHVLDHRLTPEVTALLCTMASRAPLGGVRARYFELLEAVAKDFFETWSGEKAFHTPLKQATYGLKIQGLSWEEVRELTPSWADPPMGRHMGRHFETVGAFLRDLAEDILCAYPLHPKVQGFFNKNVRDYGHSSPMELTGRPAVYVEGASWYTMWLLFDSPLCAGQEFSTRAVRHRDWPMCHEALDMGPTPGEWVANPVLKELHDGWFDLFDLDVEAWKVELRSDCPGCSGTGNYHASDGSIVDGNRDCETCNGTTKKYPWITDPQAFRPALDRARCLLPTTFATGCSQTGHLRAMARVVRDGQLLAQRSKSVSPMFVWESVAEAYEKALPGMAGMGLREAVYTDESPIPGHLLQGFSTPFEHGHLDADCPEEISSRLATLHRKQWQEPTGARGKEIAELTAVRDRDTVYRPGIDDVELSVVVDTEALEFLQAHRPFRPLGPKSYIDPIWNQLVQVRFHVQCSLAVARDWHRHRSAYPWQLRLVREIQNGGSAWGAFRLHPAYVQQSPVAKAGLHRMLTLSTAAFDRFTAEGDHYRAMLTLPLGTQVELRASGGLRDMLYMLRLRANANGANFEYEAQAKAALKLLRSELEVADVHMGLVGFGSIE